MNDDPTGTPYRRRPFCTIIPPHVLDRLAESDDPLHHRPARRTLEHDGALRTRRRVTAARGFAAPAGTPSDNPQRTVHDAHHRTQLPGTKVRGEGDQPGKDATVNRAYAGLGATFDFYLKVLGRRSIDDAGLPLNASVHYGENYDNAFWDGDQMVFGDGDGKIFLDFTIPLDVIGHELTHGVTQYTANLEYYGQSGALNESVSDVFGVLIKQYALGQTAADANWLIGEGLLGPGLKGALRSMKAPGTAFDNPQMGKDPQPGSMEDYVRTPRDNGGVHINSGIPNRAFYLLATALGGHAWERAGKVWYAALTSGRLTPTVDFAGFARETVACAKELYGEGAETEAVLKAWSQVGVPAS
ncbi:M4 family metallopeptidase [Streptomyces sp. AV19]|uniref:M4 family metallopeptidase n=1 Tax=Streptomyces sp. AV19 TaxID=2793068 RepID=UPI0018FED60B|nr:M4 family metallopeptidase [Streptomyces sp. AV19]MBH1933174.1 M4 family metallopeptidase [Streptomyces sp. AV19]MDG4531891.1 M4 family metallopeptidase [Streptomyces sp. AV19]